MFGQQNCSRHRNRTPASDSGLEKVITAQKPDIHRHGNSQKESIYNC